jgi:RNAse (barnase) inhibitor barstar
MAVFREEPNTWQRLDWRLLQNGSIAMYLRPAVLEDDISWLVENGYRVDRLDCSDWVDPEVAHAALSTALAFPDYYGRNLDALNDCMRDLDVPLEAGRVLVFERFDVPAAALGDFAYVVLDIVAGVARDKLLFGRRLITLVQSNDPALGFPPVGATPVGWNPREWLDSARKL